MKLTVFLLAIFFVVGCATDKQSDVKTPPINQTQPIDIVREYYNKAEKLQLPLMWDDFLNSNPNVLRLSTRDTIAFGEGMGALSILGAFPDTSKYFGFLLSYPADDVIPVLMTFDKDGKDVSFETEFNYGCGGSDCEYICDYTDFVIEKNLSFHSTTKSRIKVCEDNTDNMDTTIVEYFVIEKHGKILPNGKVVLNKEQTVEHKILPFNSPENPLNKIE